MERKWSNREFESTIDVNKYHLSLTNPRTRTTRCITANMLQTKVDAQCDKLAIEGTKLITLATVYVFEF